MKEKSIENEAEMDFYFSQICGMVIFVIIFYNRMQNMDYERRGNKMKKKIVLSMLLLCLACASAGCGGKSDKSAADLKSTDIEYDVDDFVTLGDYMDVEVTLNEEDYQITDENLSQYAEGIISYFKVYTKDDSKTEVGENDVIDVDYVGKKDGEAFDGGSAKNQIIDVANNCDPTTNKGFIDGFTSGLAGAKVGDVVDCKVTFPENYQPENLAGQEVTFTFTINSVQRPAKLEDLNDDLAKKYFKVNTKEEFMKQARTMLEAQMEMNRQSDIRVEVIDKVTEKCDVKELPQGLLEARVDEFIEGVEKKYCSDGTSMEEYVKNNYGSTLEEYEKDITSTMEENIKEEMVFEAIAKKEDMEFDEEGYKNFISNLVQNRGYDSEDSLYESYGPDKEAGKAYMEKIYLQQKACQKIVENTKVNYKEKENS